MPKTKVKVRLTDTDGNAFSILSRVRRELIRNCHKELAEQYIKEATAGDYDNLLRVTMEYVEVE